VQPFIACHHGHGHHDHDRDHDHDRELLKERKKGQSDQMNDHSKRKG
jgi:hypothetical protein